MDKFMYVCMHICIDMCMCLCVQIICHCALICVEVYMKNTSLVYYTWYG